MLVHVFLAVGAFYIISGKYWQPWYLGGTGDDTKTFDNIPYIAVEPEVYYFMMIALGQPLQNIYETLSEERSPDFAEMILHHIVHTGLIVSSLLSQYSRIGILIMFVHSSSDIFLKVGKVLNLLG